MPRNSQGLYTLPPSNPVSPNTLIEAEWANATMEDIGEALTGSMPRDGSAPMTGPLILKSGVPTQPREAVSKAYMEQFLAYATGMPVGAVFAFASGTTPPGYLLCNGQAVSRTTYATLFAAIGVVYGNGDGTTTFNVPDLRNEFVRGKTDVRPLGNKQEASLASHIHPVVDPTHTHGATQAAHSHSISTGGHNHGISDPGHAHNYYKGGTVAGSQYTAGVGWINNYEASGAAQTGISIAAVGDLGGSSNSVTPDVAVSAVASGVTVGATGGDETRPQNIALDYYIKAMSDTSGPVTLTGIETSDANMIAIDNTNPIVPLLDIQSNVAFGIPKLDSTGKLGLAQMPTSSAQFLGYFDASPGVLPATAGITSGDYYAVSVQGTLTVYDPVTLTAAPTLVVVGSQLHFVSGSVSNPTGWYTLTVASATLASDIQFIPGGTLNGTNVQTAISELDSETQTALGGKAPSAAATGAGTSFPPSGSIGASNVTAAIQELDTETVKLAGGTMTGNLTGTNFLAPKHQVGVSATPANNFTLDASANNGTIKLARNSGQDIVTVDAAGKPRFPQLAQSLTTDGYKVLEGGLILQWGQCANDNSQGTGLSSITFPIPFPTAVLHVSVEAYAASVGASAGMNTARIPFSSETNSYAVIAWYGANNALTTEQLAGQWFAIGY